MEHKLTIDGLERIDASARTFLQEIGERRIVAFYAPMGAGKTTFISAVCRALGVADDAVSSPTFAIVNEYRSGTGEPVFHFDFYRIKSVAEALDIGFYEYVDSGCLCLMEWPDNIEEILPEETLHVTISVSDDGTRTLRWDDGS